MIMLQKEELAEEIHRDQPHLLASCVVQPKLGAHVNDVEFLLNILLVCYQAMNESGLTILTASIGTAQSAIT